MSSPAQYQPVLKKAVPHLCDVCCVYPPVCVMCVLCVLPVFCAVCVVVFFVFVVSFDNVT